MCRKYVFASSYKFYPNICYHVSTIFKDPSKIKSFGHHYCRNRKVNLNNLFSRILHVYFVYLAAFGEYAV